MLTLPFALSFALPVAGFLLAAPEAIAGAPAAVAVAVAEPVRARLVSERTALVPGQPAALGIEFSIDPAWHLFWDGCNNTGYPITIHPKMPDGVRAREVEWPAPARLVSPGDILDHVYERRVLLILPIDVAADLAPGTDVVLACRLDWVACHDACVVGGADVSIRVPVASGRETASLSKDAPEFERARARLPRAAAQAAPWLRARWTDETLVIEADGAESLAFFPSEGCVSLVDPLADCESSANRLEIRYRRVDGRLGPASGVLDLKRSGESAHRFISLEVSVPDGTSHSSHSH